MSIWLLLALQNPGLPTTGQADSTECKYLFGQVQGSACPTTNPGTWVTTADYPPSSLRNAESGTVRFRLQVGPDGRATDCIVTIPTPYPTLNEATCRLVLERARFEPLEADSENPDAARYENSVRWEIPDVNSNALVLLPVNIDVRLTIAPDGSVTDCEAIILDFSGLEAQGGTPLTAEQYCADMTEDGLMPLLPDERDDFPRTYRLRYSVLPDTDAE